MIPPKVISDIYNEYKKFDVYGVSKETALFQVTNACDWNYISLIMANSFSASHLRDSYRASVSNIILDNNIGDFNACLSNENHRKWGDEFIRLELFNQTRNRLERVEKNMLEGNYDEIDKKIEFISKKGSRSTDVEKYMRWKHNVEDIFSEGNESEKRVVISIFDTVNGNKIYNQQSGLHPRKQWLDEIYDLMYDKILEDNTWDFTYEFNSGFDLEDFYYIYAYLMTIATINMNHIINVRVKRKESKLPLNQISIIRKKNDLIEEINKYTGVDKSIVFKIISLMTYDEEIHKKKITIYQPIFEVGEYVFFSNMMVIFGYAQDKFINCLMKYSQYKKDISPLFSQKEGLLLSKVVPLISQKGLNIKSNLKLVINNISKAEIDLCIYDCTSKILLLIEIKCFQFVDGENEISKLDKKLKDTISDRLKKDAEVCNNLSAFLAQNFENNIEVAKVVSCLLSEGYSGSIFLNDEIAVFDTELLLNLFDECEFSLEKICEKIKNRDYLPKLDKFKIEPVSWSYCGYTIKADGIRV